MADKTNNQRLVDLKAALKVAKKPDMLSLAACAALWGVTKPRFVNKRAEIAGFPDGVPGKGNSLDYPAIATIRAMIAHLDRHQSENAARVKRQARLIGGGRAGEALAMHTPAELATLNRLRADLEQDERAQGMYVPIAETQQVAGDVFSELSEFCSTLSNQIDPHGRLAPEIRTTIDSKAHEALLKFHSRMKGLLSGDALHGRTGAQNQRSGRAPARRKSSQGVARPAR
jgi:hypothetical protein